MDNAQKDMIEKLNSMPLEEARDAIATGKIYAGEIGSDTHKLALSLLASRETTLRDAHDSESLIISRKALEISEKARSDARLANKIAISAIILSAATAIGIAISQWFTKH
jgi:hypothetical protein